jgi:DNA-3-methyladenine glycosylase
MAISPGQIKFLFSCLIHLIFSHPVFFVLLYNIWVKNSTRLPRSFFMLPTLKVARSLLGKRLVRLVGDLRIAGFIIETEAYCGEEDLGCHACVGQTSRNRVMYGAPGYAYVYFTYGMHWMFNCVTEEAGFPAAVLIRAIVASEGLEFIATRRNGRPAHEWTNGPAKICQALEINRSLNGQDLCAEESQLFVETGIDIPDSFVTTTSRVGLNNVEEPWKSIPWRFVSTLPHHLLLEAT